MSSQWVPNQLTAKNNVANGTQSDTATVMQEGQAFLSCIVTAMKCGCIIHLKIESYIHGIEAHHIIDKDKLIEVEVWMEGGADGTLGRREPASYGVLKARGYCEYQTTL